VLEKAPSLLTVDVYILGEKYLFSCSLPMLIFEECE